MFVRTLICLCLLTIGHKLVAQERPTDDINPIPSTRKVSHYVGLQANQLIRQLLSFGGNNTAVTNPYALVYTVNSKETGWGLATGLGYSSIQTKTSDLFTSTTSKVDDFAWRVGFEKKTYILKNWLLSLGGDFLVESNKAVTITNNGSATNPTVTTKEKRQGFGPRASLNYHINDKLLIGTEASYYFKSIKHTQTQTNTGVTPPKDPDSSLHSFSFTLPAVIFVIVKL
jgi:hypothetical protein